MREERTSTEDLIWPLFVCDGVGVTQQVASMPGVIRRSVDLIVEAAEEALSLGIPAICLFPYTDASLKTDGCEEAWNPDNLSNRAIRAVKAAVPDIAVMTDVALDPYNAQGHDGIVRDGAILNDESVVALVRMALAQAEAGADILGPSDMMDGRIGAIRGALEEAGHLHTTIMSYAAKYASAYYGPFRDAVGASGGAYGRQEYLSDRPGERGGGASVRGAGPGRGRGHGHGQAGIALSGSVPPGEGTFRRTHVRLSGIRRIRDDSGGRAANGWVDGDRVMMESLMAFRRAGCDGVLTYFAPRAAKLIRAG